MAHVKKIDAWKVNFLRHIQQGKHITIAAKQAGIGLRQLYTARTIDIDFAREWEETKKQADERIGKNISW
jgi:hypothetical protein